MYFTYNNITWIILAMVISVFVGMFSMPAVVRFSVKHGFIDKPGTRKIHDLPIPTLGGVSIVLAFFAGVLFLVIFSPVFDIFPKRLIALTLGSLVIFALGIADDKYELSPMVKLAGQFVAALIVVLFGFYITRVSLPFGFGIINLGYWGIPLTIFWFLAIINAINLIDGLDGLAGSVSCVMTLAIAIAAILLPSDFFFAGVIGLLLTASLAGFLRYNFHPAKIFMGDAGSMFLGFVIAFISLQGMKASVSIPLLLLALPILDTCSVMVRRLIAHVPIMKADKRHLHHRLLARGWGQRKVCIVITLICACFAAVGVTAPYVSPIITGITTVALVILLIVL